MLRQVILDAAFHYLGYIRIAIVGFLLCFAGRYFVEVR